MNEPASQTHDAPAGVRRPRWLRSLLIAAGILFLAALAAAAAVPAVLSTDWGRSTALGWINAGMPGEIAADNVSLSWLGGQSVTGLTIRDAEGRPVIELASFSTDLSLLGALRRDLSLGRTEIRGLNAELVFDADGTSNLAAALGAVPGEEGEEGGGIVVPVTGNMALVDSRVAIKAPGIDPVVLEGLTGALTMSGREAPVELRLDGRSRQGDLAGTISVEGRVSNLFTDGRFEPAAARADLQARVEDLPVDALDQVLGLGGLASAALGDRTSVSLRASGDATRQDLVIDATAPRGELNLKGRVAEGRFELTEPAGARLELTPELLEAAGRTAGGADLRLARTVPLQLTLNELAVPLESFDAGAVALRADLKAEGPILLTGVQEIGDAAINDLSITLDSPGLSTEANVTIDGRPVTGGRTGELALNARIRNLVDDDGRFQPAGASVEAESRIAGIPTSLVDGMLGQGGLLTDAAGPTFGLDLATSTDDTGRIDVTLTVDAARLKTEPLHLSFGDAITLSRPAQLRLALTPALWQRLAGAASGTQLTAESSATLELTELRLPAPGNGSPAFRPGETVVNGALSIPLLSLRAATGEAPPPPLTIEGLRLALAGDTLAALEIDGSASVAQPGGILEALDASPLRLTLGARTGLEADMSPKAIDGTLQLDSSGLKGALKPAIDKDLARLSLAEPAVIDATLTPALLATTAGETGPKATLREAAGVRIRLENLSVPLAPFDYRGTTAAGGLEVAPLVVESGGRGTTIDDGAATFRFEGADGGRAELALNGRVRGETGEPGELAIDLTASRLLNADGALDVAAASLDLEGRLQELPAALLDQLLAMDGMMTASLGDTANLALETKLDQGRGPVSVKLDAANSRADIQARIGEQGLTLSAPLTANFEPTPELGQKVLAKIHPIFETTQRAEQPIRLEVPAEGVLVPLENFDFSRVTVPSMTLDFGKLVLKSGWLLRGLVGLGQQFGKLENVQREEWVAWFTPGVLAVRDGEIVYQRRLDLLLDQRLHLATWGSADIAADRSNLTLAFMPDTMERVFSITVAENDALHIPVTGPLSSPEIDFKKTAADLARLRAQEEAAGENPLAGLLLGSVVGKVTGGGAAPPPSVTPLPWADLLREQDAARQQEQADEPRQATQPAPDKQKEPSTEEKVIKGLIDLLGDKKKDE